MSKKIVIVEDLFIEANNLRMILERAGYEVCAVALSAEEALSVLATCKPDLVLLDIYLGGGLTGIDLAKILREKNIAFVYLSANCNKDTLDAAKATEPYGFLVKPFREKDVLVTLDIAHYLHQNTLRVKLQMEAAARHPVASDHHRAIIGKSEGLQKVLRHLEIVAPLDISVLIMGESGTGKEKIANLVHELSPRRHKPFIKINCAALPASLIESELFGHERGAFTGAIERRIGKFEQADSGTIFLDEIGELPMELQIKLLRVLQEKEIERIGGKRTIKVDVRIISATNRNLEKEVAEGRFRIDLYYRLNVFPLTLPPLRERKEDIPDLVHYFTALHVKKNGKLVSGISDNLLKAMMNYSWPGNIRELGHLLERAILLTQGNIVTEMDFPKGPEVLPQQLATAPRVKTIEDNERDNILAALEKTDGRIYGIGGAAELLGVPVSTLNARIKKLGIEKSKSWFKKGR